MNLKHQDKEVLPGYSKVYAETAYIVTDPVAVISAYAALSDMGGSRSVSTLLLDGPPGTGKTFLAKHLANKISARLIHFQFFEGCDRRDMLWSKSLSSEGGVEKGLLLQGIELSQSSKTVVILDEIDKASTDVDAFLLNLIEEGFVLIPQVGKIQADTSNLLIVITKNDKRNAIPPLVRRCRVVYMDWPTLETEVKIIQTTMPFITFEAASTFLEIPRRLRNNPEVYKAPSTPEIVRLIRDLLRVLHLGASDSVIGRYYVNGIAQTPKDQRFIEKSNYYLGLMVRECLSPFADQTSFHGGAGDKFSDEIARAVAFSTEKT